MDTRSGYVPVHYVEIVFAEKTVTKTSIHFNVRSGIAEKDHYYQSAQYLRSTDHKIQSSRKSATIGPQDEDRSRNVSSELMKQLTKHETRIYNNLTRVQSLRLRHDRLPVKVEKVDANLAKKQDSSKIMKKGRYLLIRPIISMKEMGTVKPCRWYIPGEIPKVDLFLTHGTRNNLTTTDLKVKLYQWSTWIIVLGRHHQRWGTFCNGELRRLNRVHK